MTVAATQTVRRKRRNLRTIKFPKNAPKNATNGLDLAVSAGLTRRVVVVAKGFSYQRR